VSGAPDADSLEYETLLMMEREGIETTHVKSGRKLVAVNISQMLNGVESEYQRKQYGNVINICGSVTGSTIIVGDEKHIDRK
jgi:endonuclease/exonuclease/phosphatase (EEP) superfamily protein YafD